VPEELQVLFDTGEHLVLVAVESRLFSPGEVPLGRGDAETVFRMLK
jgi:hypothetical protein